MLFPLFHEPEALICIYFELPVLDNHEAGRVSIRELGVLEVHEIAWGV